MNISEQIREAALYCIRPTWEMSGDAFDNAMEFRDICMCSWESIEGRTFLLLVAEALE